MTTHTSFATPSQADVDRYIAQAHQMRSDYIGLLLRSGVTRLRDIFPPRHAHENETQYYDVWGPVALTKMKGQEA